MPETFLQDIANQDLSTVAALQQKRTLAFVNHFAITTVQFLNNFVKQCEQKLMYFERKLEKAEAAMVILESRLSSIPEVSANKVTKPQVHSENSQESITTDEPKEEIQEIIPEPIEARPEYDRFVKMVQVGVPLQAVKLKVSMEGLDPNIFEEIMDK